MMNFEEKTKGWDVIFKGLISPFANRFKKYIQMEMNGNLKNSDSEGDEEVMGKSLGRYIFPPRDWPFHFTH